MTDACPLLCHHEGHFVCKLPCICPEAYAPPSLPLFRGHGSCIPSRAGPFVQTIQRHIGFVIGFHSSMGSREKSALLSAPQTDHRFLSLLLRKLLPRTSKEDLLGSPSSARGLPSSSSSMAASSASGISSIVSSELIDGDRDRIDVGVLGIEDAELKEYMGYGSLVYLCPEPNGRGEVLPEILGLIALECKDGALAL